MPEESKCEVCKAAAIQKCSGCHRVYYCSKEHQKQAWKNHKKSCKPFKVLEDKILGRHLVATRDIKKDEIVLKELPLIFGPAQTTIPVCLGCGKTVTEENSRPCSKCGWPVCSENCEKSVNHEPECYFTVQAQKKVSIHNFEVTHPNYQCITILRCLYQKQFVPNVWQKLNFLESHCSERKASEKYENDRKNIAIFIINFFHLKTVFSEEEILRICGLVMVNAHEVPTTDPSHVAIYETTSMFEHNCRSNCCKSFTANGGLIISSCEPIKKGDHLTICYTDPMWGTANRRNHLSETKFFWCNCKRCSDPTEFNTHFSSIRCTTGQCSGYLLPKTFLTNHDGNAPNWNCNICKTQNSSFPIEEILHKIGGELQLMPKGDSNACKSFITKQEKVLHKNHYHLTDVKIVLSQLVGQEIEGGLPAVSDDDIKLKMQLCKQLASLIEIIAPAEKRLRGVLLFELHAAIAEIGRRTAVSGEGPGALHSALGEARKVLAEAVDLLKYEPDILPEGKIYIQALENLRDIDVLLRTVHQTLGDSPL